MLMILFILCDLSDLYSTLVSPQTVFKCAFIKELTRLVILVLLHSSLKYLILIGQSGHLAGKECINNKFRLFFYICPQNHDYLVEFLDLIVDGTDS